MYPEELDARSVQRAATIAIRLMERRISAISFNANLYTEYKLDVPVSRNASNERIQLEKAISTLTEIKAVY